MTMLHAKAPRAMLENKKRLPLVIGEGALLIADYFEWVYKVLISR